MLTQQNNSQQEELSNLDRSIASSLKDRYKTAYISLFIYDKPLPFDECFINLNITEIEIQRKIEGTKLSSYPNTDKTEKEVFDDDFQDEWNISHKETDEENQTTIALPDILGSLDGLPSAENVLIEGRTGIGKSTLCKYIAHQWAYGKLWNKYKAVFLISLRNLVDYAEEQMEIVNMVHKECFTLRQRKKIPKDGLEKWIEQNAGQILWVFDSYEEIVPALNESKAPLTEFIKELLEYSPHIITSRSSFFTQKQQRHLEITGFTNSNIHTYIQRFFEVMGEPSLGTVLYGVLDKNPYLRGIAHVPINLELLCSIWYSNRNHPIPELFNKLTHTEIYQKIITQFILRYLQRKNIETSSLSDQRLWEYPEIKSILLTLAQIAWEGQQQPGLILTPQVFQPCLKNLPTALFDNLFRHFGLLQSMGIPKRRFIEQNYYFVHPTFQDFLTAYYLKRELTQANTDNSSNIIEFLQYQKCNPRFQVVFWFLAGLLKDEPQSLKRYLEILLEPKAIGLLGDYELGLYARIYEESINENTAPLLEEIEKHLVKAMREYGAIYIQKKFNAIFKFRRPALFSMLDWCPKLANKLAATSKLVLLLKNRINNLIDAKSICEFVAATKLIDKDACDLILDVLNSHPDAESRKAAAQSISALGLKACQPHVIKTLQTNLNDKNRGVCRAVAFALGELGELSPADIIPLLLESLESSYAQTREFAAIALANMGKKAAITKIGLALLKNLSDKNPGPRCAAAIALAELQLDEIRPQVITNLIKMVKDKDSRARQVAIEVMVVLVGKDKVSDQEVNQTLLLALNDENHGVRREAIYTATILGAANNPNLLNKILWLMLDKNEMIADVATSAIQELLAKSEHTLILHLLKLIKSETAVDRAMATKALGLLEPHQVNDDIIDALFIVLDDKAKWIIPYAVISLGYLGEKAATTDIINKLLKLSVTTNITLRAEVLKSLGALNANARSVTVNTLLQNELRNTTSNQHQAVPNPKIRFAAAKGLANTGGNFLVKENIKALQTALKTEMHPSVYEAIIEALKILGSKVETDELFNMLIQHILLEGDHGRCRLIAGILNSCITLSAISDEAIQDLVIHLMQDEDPYIRDMLIQAVGKLDSEKLDKRIISTLLLAVADDDYLVGISAAEALPSIGRAIHITLPDEPGLKDIELLISYAKVLRILKEELQICYKNQSYSLICSGKKGQQSFTLTAKQAQWLYNGLPFTIDWINGLAPWGFDTLNDVACGRTNVLGNYKFDKVFDKSKEKQSSYTNILQQSVPTNTSITAKAVKNVPNNAHLSAIIRALELLKILYPPEAAEQDEDIKKYRNQMLTLLQQITPSTETSTSLILLIEQLQTIALEQDELNISQAATFSNPLFLNIGTGNNNVLHKYASFTSNVIINLHSLGPVHIQQQSQTSSLTINQSLPLSSSAITNNPFSTWSGNFVKKNEELRSIKDDKDEDQGIKPESSL